MILQCMGCKNQTSDGCKVYLFPELQHSRISGCAMRPKTEKIEEKQGFVDPLKASKQAFKKR